MFHQHSLLEIFGDCTVVYLCLTFITKKKIGMFLDDFANGMFSIAEAIEHLLVSYHSE